MVTTKANGINGTNGHANGHVLSRADDVAEVGAPMSCHAMSTPCHIPTDSSFLFL